MIGLSFRYRAVIKVALSKRYRIIPATTCPFCQTVVEAKQKNWVDSPTDCHMICNNCKKRFKGILQILDQNGVNVGSYDFLCPEQTLHSMKTILEKDKRKNLGEKYLHNLHPKIYFSLLKNFSTYRKARSLL